jgi:hypothetical protein
MSVTLRTFFARDSLLWTWGLFAAIATAFITIGADLDDYGVPLPWVPYVRGGAVIVVAAFAYYKSSPLLSKAEIQNGGRGV